jgi:hypothetical protein
MIYRKKVKEVKAMQWDGTRSGIKKIREEFPHIVTASLSSVIGTDFAANWRILDCGKEYLSIDVNKHDFIINDDDIYSVMPEKLFLNNYELTK